MSKREQELQRQLEDAQARLVRLETRPQLVITVPPARNALQSISDWWHGGASAGARSRHMRVNY